jgi:hypothetical protein
LPEIKGQSPSLHQDRGCVLHFNADLSAKEIPGAFGWDDAASIVDASLVKSYRGTSKYLIMSKYIDYPQVVGAPASTKWQFLIRTLRNRTMSSMFRR